MNRPGDDGIWDEEDGFYYDLLRLPHGRATPIKVSSMVGLHASQSVKVDRVLINIDTTCSRELVNRQQFYVSLSRARHDAQIFTDSREALPHAISRTADKAIALDAVDGARLPPENFCSKDCPQFP